MGLTSKAKPSQGTLRHHDAAAMRTGSCLHRRTESVGLNEDLKRPETAGSKKQLRAKTRDQSSRMRQAEVESKL